MNVSIVLVYINQWEDGQCFFFLCISSIHNIIYCMYHVTLKMVHTMMTKRNNITLDVNKSVAIEEYATWTISLK